MKLNFSLLFLLLFLISPMLYSQSITNVRSKLGGSLLEVNTIEIFYQLQCDGWANVGLYISEDGGRSFSGPLKSVSGDVGSKVVPGSYKRIAWEVLKDKEMLYGSNIVFRVKAESPFNTFRDPRDGKTYKTVKIGNQVWMAENLAYKPSKGKYWAYDKKNISVKKYGYVDDNVNKLGYLYDWQTARNVCPTGWHLPSDAEWRQLTDFVGSTGTDDYGFSALHGGTRNYDNGHIVMVGECGYWWSSTENNTNKAWYRLMGYGNSSVGRSNYYKQSGYSVRCLKD